MADLVEDPDEPDSELELAEPEPEALADPPAELVPLAWEPEDEVAVTKPELEAVELPEVVVAVEVDSEEETSIHRRGKISPGMRQ